MKNMIHRPDTVASAPSGLPVAVDTMDAIQAPSAANSVVDTTLPPKMAQKARHRLPGHLDTESALPGPGVGHPGPDERRPDGARRLHGQPGARRAARVRSARPAVR